MVSSDFSKFNPYFCKFSHNCEHAILQVLW